MRYGRGACPEGFLPIFSVNSEDEAKRLLVVTCSLGPDRHYYSNEMAADQSIEQFARFGQKLARAYARFNVQDAPVSRRARRPAPRSRRPRA